LTGAALLRLAAQYLRIRSEAAFRAAADMPRRCVGAPAPFALAAGAEAAPVALPRRDPAEPCRTSIALVSRSRSSTNKAMM
jgi:hypothetical protein